MPTKGTFVLAIRVRNEIREAIDEEAARRGLSRNGLLALRLEAEFARGPEVHKTNGTVQDSDENVRFR